jgi:uncharacterized protein (TIGR02996 family)
MALLSSIDATRAAFLADICAHPDDDGVRLIYADWLEEHGQPERAEFIRVQIAVTNFQQGHERFRELEKRQAVLFRDYQEQWQEEELCGLHPTLGHGEDEWTCWYTHGVLYRGFLERLTCTWQELEQHVVCLFGQQPIQVVRLSDKKPLAYQTMRPGEQVWAWAQSTFAGIGAPAGLVPAVFALLEGYSPRDLHLHFRDYVSRGEALAALSRACVAYGRQRVREVSA